MGRCRRILALFLAWMISMSILPKTVFSAEYTAVSSLSSGSYILVCQSGWAMGALLSSEDEMPWITGTPVQVQDGVVTADNLPLWTLTVTESGVTLQDRVRSLQSWRSS